MPKKLVLLGVGLALLLGFVVVSAGQPSANEDVAAEEEMAPAEVEPAEEMAGKMEVEMEVEMEAEAGPSLYDRLGGTYAIAAVVDDLIDRLAADEGLNANPGIAAARILERFPGLKFHLTAMICQATGGPCGYTGRSMKDTHIDMGITASDWELFAADCKATLDKFGVPEAEQNELFAIIGSTQGDIVVAE